MSDEETPLLPRDGDEGPPPPLASRLTSVLATPSSLNSLERFLALSAVFFLLLSVTGFGLFTGEAVRAGRAEKGRATVTQTVARPGPTVAPRPGKGSNAEVCTTPTCVTVASGIISALDESVDPCEDFYTFANGGWLDSHPVPDDVGLYGIAQDIGLRNKRVVLSILNEPTSPSISAADQRNIASLKRFWSSCLDEDHLTTTGITPLLSLVREVVAAWRGESAFGTQESGLTKERKERLTAVLAFLHARGIPALFETYAEGDVAKDPKTLVLWMTQSGLGLPSKDYYEDDEALEVYTSVIKKSLESVYTAMEESLARDLAKEVVEFESRLAKASLGVIELEDPKGTYNPTNATTLSSIFPLISFADYFASFTPRPAYPDPIIVTSPKYIGKMAQIVEDTEERVLEGYFAWRVIQSTGSYLGPKEPIRKEVEWLDNYLGGVEQGVSTPRGDVCLASLLENYGFLIGRYYIQRAFTGDSKEYAEDIIVATIQAFKDRLPELDWLDDATRAAAEEKANAITYKIGYPTTPDTMDPLSLERYYSLNERVEGDDFFGNVVRSNIAQEKRKWIRVGKQLDKGIWDMIPSEVNAYYSPPANEIAFPAGILQRPYFSKDFPEYSAFGVFGSVAGHELSHAFDQMGRQYNKDGKLEDWWSNTTTAKFEELKVCLLDQYANYTVLDARGKAYHVNSKFTNGEDMADGGGLAQSYRAWTDRYDSDRSGLKYPNYLLPGLDAYSREQLFYIAYAQGWARNIKPAEAVKRIRTDPHSPTKYRVIGPLSNNEDFSKAFGCRVGQPMSNVDKCSVW